ncbi:MAG: PilZ domain-containing protein [Myxococcota bacterium]
MGAADWVRPTRSAADVRTRAYNQAPLSCILEAGWGLHPRQGSTVSRARKNDERRRGNRVPMSAAVTALDPRATTPVSDLSETGVFVHTENPLPVGSDIELRFTVMLDEPVLFVGRGVVKRHQLGDEPHGMGVEFVKLEDTARDVLGKIMLRAAAAKSTPLARTHEGLRTHGLVASLLDE